MLIGHLRPSVFVSCFVIGRRLVSIAAVTQEMLLELALFLYFEYGSGIFWREVSILKKKIFKIKTFILVVDALKDFRGKVRHAPGIMFPGAKKRFQKSLVDFCNVLL